MFAKLGTETRTLTLGLNWGDDPELLAKVYVAAMSGLLGRALEGVTLDQAAVAKFRGDIADIPILGYF